MYSLPAFSVYSRCGFCWRGPSWEASGKQSFLAVERQSGPECFPVLKFQRVLLHFQRNFLGLLLYFHQIKRNPLYQLWCWKQRWKSCGGSQHCGPDESLSGPESVRLPDHLYTQLYRCPSGCHWWPLLLFFCSRSQRRVFYVFWLWWIYFFYFFRCKI